MIITPVIFLSRDNQEVDTVFSNNDGLVNFDLVKDSNSSNFYVGSQGKNIIKLTHEVNFGSEQVARISLEVIDPERRFEEFFLSPIQNDPETVRSLQEGNKVTVFSEIAATDEDNIYIAYGFGDKRENWAAPQVVKFVDLQIDVGDDGVRSFKLGFVPSLSPLATKGYAFYEEDIRCTGTSRLNIEREFKQFNSPQERASSQVSQINLSKVIQECVGEFISRGASTRNVITLIPEVEKTHAKAVERIKNIRKVQTNYDLFAGITFDITKFKSDIFGEDSTEFYRQAEGNVRDFLTKNFGIQVSFGEEGLDEIRNAYLESYGNVGGLASFETERNNIRKLVAVLEGEREKTEQGQRILYEKALRQIADGFGKGDTYSPRMKLVYETDLNILSLWKKFGYIKTKRAPAVIYGDSDMIDLFLYGRYYYEDLENIPVVKYARSEDVFKYSNKDNLNQLAEVTKTNFGPFNSIPDELALENVEFLSETFNLPVFKQGFSNADVLSLSVDLNKAFFASLKTRIEVKKAIATARSLFDKQDIFKDLVKTREEVLKQFEEWVGASYDDRDVENFRKKVSSFVFKNLTVRNSETKKRKEEIVKIIVSLVEKARKEDDVSESLFVDENNAKTTELLRLQTLESAYNLGYRATIRTLPRFKSSYYGFIGTPSLLLARHPYVYGVNDVSLASDAFYSGLYSIAGFKHTIGVDEGAFSEFALYKSPQSGGVDIFRELDFNEGLQRTSNR